MTSSRRCDIIESAKMHVTGRFAFVSRQTQHEFVGEAPFLYGLASCLRLSNGGRNVQEGRFDMKENEQPTEEWRAIHDFPGYEVSNLGRVRSFYKLKLVIEFAKNGWDIGDKPQRFLVARTKPDGYLYVRLSKDGRRYTRATHRLVARAFLGERPDGQQICHHDGIKTNNVLGNLRYDTAKGNVQDHIRHKAETQAFKLSDADVLLMRQLAAKGAMYVELASRFGVSRCSVRSACIGDTYRWVSGPLSKIRQPRKLNYALATQIRKESTTGIGRDELAKKYNVSRSTIDYVVQNKVWIPDQSDPTKRKARKCFTRLK